MGILTRLRDCRSRAASSAAKGRVLSRMEEYVDVERVEDGEASSALEVRGDAIERKIRARIDTLSRDAPRTWVQGLTDEMTTLIGDADHGVRDQVHRGADENDRGERFLRVLRDSERVDSSVLEKIIERSLFASRTLGLDLHAQVFGQHRCVALGGLSRAGDGAKALVARRRRHR